MTKSKHDDDSRDVVDQDWDDFFVEETVVRVKPDAYEE